MKTALQAIYLLCLVLGTTLATQGAERKSDLDKGFITPPASARPWVYWFWLNGNITSNGITADLEAMRQVGIGGVLIMEVDQGAPKGPAGFGQPAWRDLFKHVCAEAHRLGLEVNMNNDAGWCGSGGPWITPELAMQKVVWTETSVEGPRHFDGMLPQPKAVANYYRDIALLAFPTPAGNVRIEDIDGKSARFIRHLPVDEACPALPAGQTIARDHIIELTPQLGTNGKFAWDVPAGKWTILRVGHTPTGVDNHPAPEAGRGLESDKLSKAATEAMFNGLMARLVADSKPLVGKTLVATHIDSWETGSQNWTPLFRKEFQKRRGYDPLPFLPAMTGRVVDSREVSERFLWDVRQTVGDLLVENYAGRFRALAHKHGLRLSIEAYDGEPADDITYGGQADEPMAEFWSWGYTTPHTCLEMSSVAHVYGKRILGAEAFTATDGEKWLGHPAVIKTLGDWAFCEGINRFVFHRYAMQPWLDRPPGMSMGPWGLHYERTQTWWEQSAAWHEYLARCQFLLRLGLFVADICFLEPEGSPRRFTPNLPGRSGNAPDRPRYNFDACTPEVVLMRMKVKDGRLVLPDGMSYRVLVLPQVQTMTPGLLRKVLDLVKSGATVIGPPPVKSPSLSNYPQCDAEVQKLAAELWSDAKPERSTSGPHPNVIWHADLKTPQTPTDAPSPIERAKWIWHKEGNPAAAAPVGPRYFRRALSLPAEKKIASARMVMTADNSFELSVNGQLAGSGENLNQIYTVNVSRLLKPGDNLIAVTAVNGGQAPNPAGLIGTLAIKFTDGSALEVDTDRQWQSATNASPNWMSDFASVGDWEAAMELGPLGMAPWGRPDKFSAAPYVYPDFKAITALLNRLGVKPDFECVGSDFEPSTADTQPSPLLRTIHRRDGKTDIYFVANAQTNWVASTCAFRVSGKVPELWNPITGGVEPVAIFEEKDGRTFLPLWLEPAGSRFVVFREPGRHSKTKPSLLPIASVTRDGQNVLPAPAPSIGEPPPMEIHAQPNGEIHLLAWNPGRYELKSGSGQLRGIEVPALPLALELRGPWQVRFQAGRGAPETVTFDALTDWSQHADAGVKYFSGTAVYTKSFRISPELRSPGQRLYLDLGKVAVMAQVKLNDKELGTLWKPPFRVDITDSVKVGENKLQVRVVNLWINRMIGDEQLPEDSDRNPNGTLKQWPSWLQADRPSPTGRFTFTSWRLWKKDSPLQESGLLGPVKIINAREFDIARP